MKAVLLCLLFCNIILSSYASNEENTYIAAVYEYFPRTSYASNLTKDQANEVMLFNVASYEEAVILAVLQGVQVIVFPEDGIYGDGFISRADVFPFLEEIPVPDASTVICGNEKYSNLVVTSSISCIAKKYSIIIAVDMGDLVYCNSTDPNCPSDGRYQYNTAVVFDEQGAIVAKYHKTHLYGEVQFDPAMPSDPQYFTSSFGVTFGVMICFDILFEYPQTFYQEKGINNILYPTDWVNEPPYITATQVQQAVSHQFGYNLIAANFGENWLTSGSGIYSSGDPKAVFYNIGNNSDSKLLVAELPYVPAPPISKKASDPQKDVNKMMVNDYPIPAMALVNITAGRTSYASLSQGNLTCTINVTASPSLRETEFFLLMAAEQDIFGLNVQLCSFMYCDDENDCSPLQPRFYSTAEVSAFTLTATLDPAAEQYSLLTITESQVLPVGPNWQVGKSVISSNNFNEPLLSVGIFGPKW